MSETNRPSPELIEIRKYSNRRYYDRTHSRHLTLEDIRELIRKGANVSIIDSQSGADITSKTLTQMILEFDAPKLELFTVPLLTELIRVNDRVVKGFFEKFFHQTLSAFLAFQQHLEQQFRAGSMFPGLLSGWNPWSAGIGSAPAQPLSATPGLGGHLTAVELSETVQKLQRQVASLQAELAQQRQRKKR